MGRSKSFDASISDLRSIYTKLGLGSDRSDRDEAEDDAISRSELLEEMRTALREGLVSNDIIADEIINDIMLTASNPQDRLRAAELIKKNHVNKKNHQVGSPPKEEDLERFCRIIEETREVREAIEERRAIASDAPASVRE